ncbi:putative GntR family transcriptional regulator [Sphingomonas changbaiensis NBRC 104936]|uniref:Putative GntR family transcriptional regulator n=1 Tax=Sphingomonas changbaiensis NBRC 104936 TaxID=1219043 RepID=A0A0E9MQ53_9SPHN|nr:PLP-dependent aminotransferase family protein [Sphingomonas changbaiensis]GAO39265.1 putative GntR family transcriptional regulator [Sphingomonas changbaiensis NBRC 104936]
MSGALAMREMEGLGRSRAPAFLPADLAPEPQGGLYQGLYKRLRAFILDGVWPPGTRLPSSRTLAADLRVSRNTAILAVEQLVADGWAESRSRSGVYVSAGPAVASSALPQTSARDAVELPPFALQRPAADLFPAQIWKQLQARAWAEIEPQRLASADPAGDAGLRETIARLVCAPRGLRCHPDQILIVPTATAAIDLAAAALLRAGDTALVEDASRPAVRQLLAARGARLQTIGQGGTERLARLACVAPAVSFPTCTSLDSGTRAWLLGWAREQDGWIVEDDRDSELWFDEAPPPPPLAVEDGARVLLVGSFNRILFPGLCVAFLVAPPALAERLRTAHGIVGGRASLASQLALRAFIAEGHFARHLRRRRQAYVERRAALIEALAGIVDPASVNRAGLHLVVNVGAGRASAVAARLAAARLGGAAAGDLMVERGADSALLLGLGATPEAIRLEGPRLAAVISEGGISCTRPSRCSA